MKESLLPADRPFGDHRSHSGTPRPIQDAAGSTVPPRFESSFFDEAFHPSPSSPISCYATAIHDSSQLVPHANAAVSSRIPSYQQAAPGPRPMPRGERLPELSARYDQSIPSLPRGFLTQPGCPTLRGIEKFAEASHAHVGVAKARRIADESLSQNNRTAYNSPFTNLSTAFSPPAMATTKPPEPGLFTQFRGYFEGSQDARRHRQQSNRRSPHRQPDNDESIEDIKNNRQWHVKRIYDAMTRPDAAKDNQGSVAMKRWVRGPTPYEPALVEAYAHKIFDCLIEAVELGFRGWPHNDYVSEDRKGGEDEDQEMSCLERLDGIIQGLEEEKTICEDMMASACQIRMFVNAPRAYAQRKFNNRVGNSKRGRSKKDDEAVGGKSKKARKLASRPQTTPHPSLTQSSQPERSGGGPKPLAPYFHNQPPPTTYPSPSSQVATSPFMPTLPDFTGLTHGLSMPMSPPLNMGLPPFTTMFPPRQPHTASAPTYPHLSQYSTSRQALNLERSLANIDPAIMSNNAPDELYTASDYRHLGPCEDWHDFIVADHLVSPEIGRGSHMSIKPIPNVDNVNTDSLRGYWETHQNVQSLPEPRVAKHE